MEDPTATWQFKFNGQRYKIDKTFDFHPAIYRKISESNFEHINTNESDQTISLASIISSMTPLKGQVLIIAQIANEKKGADINASNRHYAIKKNKEGTPLVFQRLGYGNMANIIKHTWVAIEADELMPSVDKNTGVVIIAREMN